MNGCPLLRAWARSPQTVLMPRADKLSSTKATMSAGVIPVGASLRLSMFVAARPGATSSNSISKLDGTQVLIVSCAARLLAELHRDSLYPMMGKTLGVAGDDRREAPGPKPVRLGRRLRLRRQPPESWKLWNGGVQRGVSARCARCTHECSAPESWTGDNGSLPPGSVRHHGADAPPASDFGQLVRN